MTVSGLEVTVVRKDVRSLRLAVVPPEGTVRVSAPRGTPDAAIARFVSEHLDWIERHRARFARIAEAREKETGGGTLRLYLGTAYPFAVSERPGRARIDFSEERGFSVSVPPGGGIEKADSLLEDWYRGRLREALAPLVERRRDELGVDLRDWSVRRMKTRWGSCNVISRRIWFSLELAKRPPECLDYLVVHELAHLIERGHGPRFKAILDARLPDWKRLRRSLHGEV